MNLRASYAQETEEMVGRLIDDLAIDRIAILYQDDSFGRAGYRGVRQALERRRLGTIGDRGVPTQYDGGQNGPVGPA